MIKNVNEYELLHERENLIQMRLLKTPIKGDSRDEVDDERKTIRD